MEEDKFLEENRLIAEFMGYEKDEYGNFLMGEASPQFRGSDHAEWCTSQSIEYDFSKSEDIEKYKRLGHYYWLISDSHLCYEASWDWLMPVVKKIEILMSDSSIPNYKNGYSEWMNKFRFAFWDIECLYDYVVEFIKWYKLWKS